MGDISIVITEECRNYVKEYGKSVAKKIAVVSRDLLTQEYAHAVEGFYGAYSPQVYNRKYQLRNSFKPFYKNPHGTRYRGGVEITAERMDDIYQDSPSEVLNSALAGYHGPTAIYTPPWIGEHVLKFHEILFGMIESLI